MNKYTQPVKINVRALARTRACKFKIEMFQFALAIQCTEKLSVVNEPRAMVNKYLLPSRENGEKFTIMRKRKKRAKNDLYKQLEPLGDFTQIRRRRSVVWTTSRNKTSMHQDQYNENNLPNTVLYRQNSLAFNVMFYLFKLGMG